MAGDAAVGVGEGAIRVGISACLLGEEVRFDGGHKHDAYVTGTLGRYFEFVPFCPEVAVGLGTPRQPIRLVHHEGGVRARGVKDPTIDPTEGLIAYGSAVADQAAGFSGFILKRASPSCGMERVKVYRDNGHPTHDGSGLFAAALMAARPLLPVEEEGRLGDPVLRENFIERVFLFNRWQRLVADGLTPKALVRFHTAHKLMLMAHCQQTYRDLGRLVAEAGRRPMAELAQEYITRLMAAFKKKVTRGRHVNVLLHLMGYLKDHLDSGDKAELVDAFETYRAGRLPLIVPITLLRHHFRRHPDPYIDAQFYLTPHPDELMLRNTI
ncbi:MAG: DUF523 and DUF1722 domain-containing protein [Gammaproteobacteria bacterium]|nr:DUF523 and DUF1722 domain-containing protein [Gammaproteobacteria bacterium]